MPKEITGYLDLVDESKHWQSVEERFVKDYCRLMGLSQESGLLLTTEASTMALPKLTKVMNLIKGGDWVKSSNELPIEIDLGKDFKFHNIFICPVSKEASTSQKDNPPMLLTCGHVISKNSLNRIARQSVITARNQDGKFKCHTCPTTMTLDKVVEIKIN